MLRITNHIVLADDEIELCFVRGSGPGGQHVNTSSTAVQLRFDVIHSPSLPSAVKQRLQRLAGSRLSAEGMLVIDARVHRSQWQNRQEAIERLTELIRRAAVSPKRRHKTQPSRAAVQRRLDRKSQRSGIKRLRRPPTSEA